MASQRRAISRRRRISAGRPAEAGLVDRRDCFLHNVGPASKYAIVPMGERIDAVEGNIVGVQPGAVIDIIPNGKRFQCWLFTEHAQ